MRDVKIFQMSVQKIFFKNPGRTLTSCSLNSCARSPSTGRTNSFKRGVRE